MIHSSPISTIIVNYNTGPLLLEAVKAVVDQVMEVILVDNNSHDQSLAFVESHFINDPRIRIIRNQANLGFAAACNIGAANATQAFLFFLNPDCICDPHSISRLYQVLVQNPLAGMAGGLLLNPDGSEQAGGRRLTPTPGRTLVRSFGLQRLSKRWPKLFVDFNLHQQPLPIAPIQVEAISGACMLVRPEAIATVGLWDDAYFLHCEDLDWCMRFRLAGWQILFVPEARFNHSQGTCSKTRPLFVEWHKHKGMSRFYCKFFRKDYSIPLLCLVLSAIWVRFVLISAMQLLKAGNGR